MHILFLIRSLNYGGAERQIVALVGGLQKRGHSVTVVVFYPDGPLQKDLEKAQVTVISLNKRGRWDIFAFLWRLIRVVRRNQPEILHGYLTTPNNLIVLLKPFFLNPHIVWGVRASNMDLSKYGWLSTLTYWLQTRLSHFPGLVIANSQAGLTYAVQKGFPAEKIRVIPNGIDTNHFRPDPKARAKVRTEWGISDHETLIGLVGRLDPMKDHPTFLQAVAQLAQNQKNVRFVCVGDGSTDYRRQLQSLSQELGLSKRLVWAGSRSDMPAVYNALDISSSSSSGEGFPNVIGEAMACGVPCIVTDVGDLAKIVGETGYVIPPKQPAILAKKMAQMLALDLSQNKIAARQRIEQKFSLKQLVENTEKALKSVVDK